MPSDQILRSNLYSQIDGSVFIEDESGTVTMIVSKDDSMSLLSTVLNAIRIEGDTEKMRACRMMCKAMLGRES